MNDRKQKQFFLSTKMWFYAIGLVFVLGFIVVSAVWDLTFGTFDPVTFVSDVLILVAIALMSMSLSDGMSQEVNMNKTLGVYNEAVDNYEKALKAVEPIKIYFSQWFLWFKERETKNKRLNWLTAHNIDGISAKKILKYATMNDLAGMYKDCDERGYKKTLPDGKIVRLPKLETEEAYQAAKSVLNGEHDVKAKNYSVYLYLESADELDMDTLSRQDYLKKRKEERRRRAYRRMLVRVIGLALLFAALVPADPEEATANKWWIFLKRIGTFCTTFISGWLVGSNEVVGKAALIKDKRDKIEIFKDCHDKGLWHYKTEDELDAEILAQWEKEDEEAKASVIEPEIVAEGQLLPPLGNGR